MTGLTALVFLLLFVWSTYYWFKALAHLSDSGQDHFWRILLWSKIFAGRENFTQKGWRYRNRSLLLMIACFVYFLAWAILHTLRYV